MAQITLLFPQPCEEPLSRYNRKEINGRLPRCGQLFPQLIKLLTLSRRPKLIRIGTRLHRVNIIQVVVLSDGHLRASANYGLLGRQGLWPHGRVAFYLCPTHTNSSRLPTLSRCSNPNDARATVLNAIWWAVHPNKPTPLSSGNRSEQPLSAR